jgi:hypothetical protein
MNTSTMFGDLDTLTAEATKLRDNDLTVGTGAAVDAATTIPCGITISIVLGC